jgi:hypothetical protein
MDAGEEAALADSEADSSIQTGGEDGIRLGRTAELGLRST